MISIWLYQACGRTYAQGRSCAWDPAARYFATLMRRAPIPTERSGSSLNWSESLAMLVNPVVSIPSPGCCIYCRRTCIKLTREHVIPLSFGCNMVIEEASCDDCAKETHAIEGHCAGRMLKALRVQQKFPTRRPKERPTHLQIREGKHPEGAQLRLVPVSEAPGAVALPKFEPPGILLGQQPLPGIRITGHYIHATTPDAVARQKRLIASGFSGALAHLEYEPVKFARVLAKIAHCAIVAGLGLNSFNSVLVPLILGKDQNVSYYVGNGGPVPNAILTPSFNSLHQMGTDLITINGARYIFVQIRLFSNFRPLSPVYTIVAGEFLL